MISPQIKVIFFGTLSFHPVFVKGTLRNFWCKTDGVAIYKAHKTFQHFV